MAKKKADTAESTARKLEAVTVRISPQARWTLELLTRAMSKPTSTVFEWCIQAAARLIDVPTRSGQELTVLAVANQFEDSELMRALALDRDAPSLLNLDDRAITETIRISPELVIPSLADEIKNTKPRNVGDEIVYLLDIELLESHWARFKELAHESFSSQPRKPVTRAQLTAPE